MRDPFEDKRLNREESKARRMESVMCAVILVCIAVALFMAAIRGGW